MNIAKYSLYKDDLTDSQRQWIESRRWLLYHNVPKFIKHIIDCGGVREHEWEWIRREDDKSEHLAGIIDRADDYLLYPKDKKTFDKGIFILILGLAIMSFIPGGVRIFGLHFCSEFENFVDDEAES